MVTKEQSVPKLGTVALTRLNTPRYNCFMQIHAKCDKPNVPSAYQRRVLTAGDLNFARRGLAVKKLFLASIPPLYGEQRLEVDIQES